MATAIAIMRPARAEDVIPLAKLLGWPMEAIEHRWREVARGERGMFVAEVDGCPVGSVSFNMHDEIPDLLHLFALDIARRYRRFGIGTSLIKRVEEEATSRGTNGIWLDVEVANEDARRLYERLGYGRDGEVVINRYTAYPSGEEVEEACYRMVKRYGAIS